MQGARAKAHRGSTSPPACLPVCRSITTQIASNLTSSPHHPPALLTTPGTHRRKTHRMVATRPTLAVLALCCLAEAQVRISIYFRLHDWGRLGNNASGSAKLGASSHGGGIRSLRACLEGARDRGLGGGPRGKERGTHAALLPLNPNHHNSSLTCI